MLFSIALMLLIGFICSGLFQKMNLPGLLGMMLAGICLGPHVLDLLSEDLLYVSDDLRKIALIIILVRAGLSLDLKDLKVVGRPALLLSFLPASLEILAFTCLSPLIFNMTYLEGALLGSVIAAVSPAVIVPRMLLMLEKGQGTRKKIPQLIMASASVDDIFVIILFSSFMTLSKGQVLAMPIVLQLPLSLVVGLVLGLGLGLIIHQLFKTFALKDTSKVLWLLSVSFLMVELEKHIPLASLLSVMVMAMTLLRLAPDLSQKLKVKFANLWVGAEIVLFVLVGAAVPLAPLKSIGLLGLVIIVLALMARLIGVVISLKGAPFTLKEKGFCVFAYMPKATVQAALAPLPLAAGLDIGSQVLTLGVLSIFITAPLGAIAIDHLKYHWIEA